MLGSRIIQSVCDRAEGYWRGILRRNDECRYFISRLGGDCQERVQAAACTVDALHTLFPLESAFQRSGGGGTLLLGRNRPLWIQNEVGIWHPIVATVFNGTVEDDVFEEVPVKEILGLLISQVMDSIYVLAIEMNSRNMRVRMENLFDRLECVVIGKRHVVGSAFLDVRKMGRVGKARRISPQEQMTCLLKIYRSVVKESVSAELIECGRFTRRCEAFIGSEKCLMVNRAFQKMLFDS